MLPSIIYVSSIILVVFILTAESSYNVFTYDDGIGDDEHCCLVQLGENFCLAKPLTRSLVQVHKECQRLGVDGNSKNYLKKVVRRLNVETSKKLGDKILIELKAPIDKDILHGDLLCLSSANNNINLEKCSVELSNVTQTKKKRKAKNGTAEEPVDEEKPDDENKVYRVEADESVLIHQGHGLAIRQTFELNLTDIRTTNRQQRTCWAWYRTHTKTICNQPKKFKKTCIPLNNVRAKYLQHLITKKTNDDEQQQTYSTNSLTKGSKLYCEDNNDQTKLLGYYRRSEICFQTNNQITIEHKFTDYVSLSDINKNQDVLRFISNNTKLTNEFEKDCNDKTTLAEIKKEVEKEAESNENDDNASEDAEPTENDDDPST